MGTDIHPFVEIKNNQGDWVAVKGIDHIYKRLLQDKKSMADTFKTNHNINNYRWLPINRNYFLFGLLAGVREKDVEPIDLPRDIPDDVSKEIEDIYHYDADICYDFSHLYLDEIINHDWDDEIYESGLVDKDNYEKWINSNNQLPPELYTTVGKDHEIVDNQTMYKIIKGELECKTDKKIYTKVQIPVKHKDLAKRFYYWIIPLLKTLGKPENVRLIFWFDN